MTDAQKDPIVKHPTWYSEIRLFFRDVDVSHMGAKGIDLGSYAGVVANATSVYAQTQSGSMPPDAAGQWSANKVQSFLNWITDGYPMGKPADPPSPKALFEEVAVAPRIRKDVSQLDDAELAALRTAFEGMMARDPTAIDSYFAIAGVHWFPAIDQNPAFHCLHHEDRFLAWHRIHLKKFEDALRSVPGCGAVTLPYWDITTPLPAIFYEAPFDSYKLQAEIGHGYDPLVTTHYAPDEIAANIGGFKVAEGIVSSLGQASWNKFNPTFWQVHDNGHVSCGSVMRNQDIASFDPLFWFFHCNLDRIWFQWQQSVKATTLSGFKSTIQGSTAWLDVPALGVLPPFAEHAADAITLAEIAYAPPHQETTLMAFENAAGNTSAIKPFRLSSDRALSVRVKDINRSKIPGTFVVRLMADGEEVARQAFFQPTDPKICPKCIEEANVSIDFRVDPHEILDKSLSLEVHVPGQEAMGTGFPLSKIGAPTINVRHLIEPE